MTNQTFIKFDGIDGESAHKHHKGEIEVLSWDWGLTATPGTAGSGSGRGKATPKELRVVHRYDMASPVLAKNAASGRHIATAVLSARKSGEGQKDFFKVTMKEVFITSVSVSAAAHDGDAMEEVAMSYRAIEFAYSPQSSKGSLGAQVKFNWDLKTGTVS